MFLCIRNECWLEFGANKVQRNEYSCRHGLFGENIYLRSSYATFINWAINKKYTCVHCLHTQGLLLPQLLDGHVLLAVLLHHLVTRISFKKAVWRQQSSIWWWNLTWHLDTGGWKCVLTKDARCKPSPRPSQSPPGLRELSFLWERTCRPLCKHPEDNHNTVECVCVIKLLLFKVTKRWTDLHFSARSSRHQLCDFPQVNATSEIHFPGVDLKNVQTSLQWRTSIILLD